MLTQANGQRVVIYGINYAPEMAGVGRYSGEIGAFLAAQGHAVSAVTTPPHYPGWRALPPYSGDKWMRETVDGVDVHRCPLYLHPQMQGIRRLLAPLSFALSSAIPAFRHILKTRPQVVLIVEPTLFVAPVGLFAAKLVGAKTVLHVQDLEIDAAFAVGHLGKGGLMARLAAAFERSLLHRFDRVITISTRMAEKIAEKGIDASRIEVVRNWVDIDLIKPLAGPSPYRAELGLADDCKVVLYSGNIGAKQGVGLIIEAAERLADRHDIQFIVAGEGPMRPLVEAASQRLGNIRLLGFQPEARFSDFLGLADIHILPQELGTADLLLPSKLGGMLASGRPILVTADPGTELATFLGESCVFSPPGDGAAVAQAVSQMAAAPLDPEGVNLRLERARRLSKTTLIRNFETAALFMSARPAEAAHEAPALTAHSA